MKRKNNSKAVVMIVSGTALVLVVSLTEGFANAAANAFNHIIKDFTSELPVHAYIAGAILSIRTVYSCKEELWSR